MGWQQEDSGSLQGNLPGACPPPEAASPLILVFAAPTRSKRTPSPSCPHLTYMTDHNSVTLATEDAHCQRALVLGQPSSSHRATETLVVLLTPQVSDLRTVLRRISNKVIVGNLTGAMLIWPFQKVPRSGSPSPCFTDGSSLITESVSSWMLVHGCYPILMSCLIGKNLLEP